MRTLAVYALAAVAGITVGLVLIIMIDRLRWSWSELERERRRRPPNSAEADVLSAVDDLETAADLPTLTGWLVNLYDWPPPVPASLNTVVMLTRRLLERGLLRWRGRGAGSFQLTRRGRRTLRSLRETAARHPDMKPTANARSLRDRGS